MEAYQVTKAPMIIWETLNQQYELKLTSVDNDENMGECQISLCISVTSMIRLHKVASGSPLLVHLCPMPDPQVCLRGKLIFRLLRILTDLGCVTD